MYPPLFRMPQLPIHFCVGICLQQNTNLSSWTAARLLCREALQETTRVTDTTDTTDTAYGRAALLREGWCTICENDCVNPKWQRYQLNKRFHYIPHCRTWQCQVLALKSMIAHCRVLNRVLLRTPWGDALLAVPRSDGSETIGHCDPTVLLRRADKYYVETWWDKLSKLVPLAYYTTEAPKIMEI